VTGLGAAVAWLRAGFTRLLVRKAGTPEPVGPAERERRAMAALQGPRGYYGLGAGGRDPAAALPWGSYQARKGENPARVKLRTAAGKVWCDCSGAVSWALGVPRRIAGYARGWGYVSTDGLIADANDPAVELVRWADEGATVEPWTALVVYGSVDADGDGDRDSIGHVGLVAGVPEGWVYTGPPSLEQLTVWHCAASTSPTGAIRLSSGKAWARRGRLLLVL
jgi:hypothetical protein